MEIDSKYTKKFVSDSLTKEKYDELHNFAVYLLDFKNKISNEVNNNLFYFLDFRLLEFVTFMRKKHENEISSSFDKQLYAQVITCYQNKFKAIQNNLKFEKLTFKGFDFYKRDTKKNKRGNLKKVIVKHENSDLSICLTYLARYGNENIIEYIKSNIDSCDKKKQEFYNNILSKINKFGFDRLYRLALSKRDRIIRHYQKNVIEFKSLTFSGRSRKKYIINYNKNYNSIINSFISLSWFGRKSFDIPIRYSKDYHGNIKDYKKKTNDYEYTISFDEKHKQVNVHICKDGKRYIPNVNGHSEIIGIDVNVKNNLFALSNGATYKYEDKLVSDFCKLSKHLDEVKSKQGKDYKVGKKNQAKLNKLRENMLKSNQQLIANICKELKNQGITHIVMENLDSRFGKSHVKDKSNEDINFNRVVKFLGISSLKNEVEHIARKYDIALSLVHASYTSKMCPICGCIEDENRPNQETFDCIECGHKDNADHNASINIKNRVYVAVLRDKLLKQMDNGAYEPKRLNKDKVKEVLLSYRTNLIKDRVPLQDMALIKN